MKTHASLGSILAVAGALTLFSSPSIACSRGHDLVPFTGTEGPIGPSLGLPPIPPDEDGMIRIRNAFSTNCRMAFTVPRLDLEPFAVDVEFFMNADIDTTAGPGAWTAWGECWGYITDGAGNRQCVLRAYYHSRRKQVADALWVSDAEWLGTFCAGPLEGFGMKASERAEADDAAMANGYTGRLTGVLIVPDSFDRPSPACPGAQRRR